MRVLVRRPSAALEHATRCPAPQELPPGLYSLGLGPASGPHAAVQRHAWTDPLWDRLSAYRRAPDATCPGLAHDEAALQAAAAHVLGLLAHAVAVRCCCVEDRGAAAGIAPPAARACSPPGRRMPTAACPAGSSSPGGSAAGVRSGAGHGEAGRGPAASGGAAEQARLPPARVLVLFSGGVDSSLLAVLAHRALPAAEPIDLACICFDAGRSPDRHARCTRHQRGQEAVVRGGPLPS